LFIAIIAYAIVRHRLMDIELIIKKTIVFAGLFLVSFAVVAFFVFIGTAIFEDVLNNRWMSLMPSVIVIVLIFRPVESFLRSTTDRFLFQKKYDYKDILKTFTGEVLTVLDLDDLGKLTVMKLVNIMKLDGASIILHDEKSGAYKYLVSEWPEKAAMGAIPDLQPLHSLLSSSGYYLKGSGPGPEQPGKHTPAAINMLAELRGELIIILRYSGKALGFILLGKKKSDEEFYQDDLDILLPLAHTLSIAITNAMLFDKLSETQAQAAQQEKMAVIGTLSAGINHEICNPLGIIRGQCEMFTLNMKDGLYKDKTPSELVVKALEIMNKVIKETDRATGITKKLSAFAKPAKGSIEDDVELLKELEEVISLIEHDCHLNDIVIVKDIPKDLPCISADRKQTQEILFNIIKNAAQAVKTKGTIIISATHRRGRVLIDIEDTGPGIEKEYLDRIFDPFFTTKAPGEGTGLGLFIVKQIIEKNNGFISVESKKGKGTVFHLAFMASDERAHGGG
jgi:signal transduction histidine kinase